MIHRETSLSLTINASTLKGLFGRLLPDIASVLFADYPKEEQLRLIDRCCQEEHKALLAQCAPLYPDLEKTLQQLKENYRLFIVSNCQAGYIEVFLEYYHLGDLVADIECYGNTQQQKDVNLQALIERNHYETYYYLGDTQGDYNACQKAGVPFLFAAYGFGTVDAQVPQVESLEQLPEVMKYL